MSRSVMAILLSSALILGSASTSAWSATEAQASAAISAAGAQRPLPLPPGGAAGIRQAQGFENSPWLGIGLLTGIFVLGWVLLDDDDDSSPTTGTN